MDTASTDSPERPTQSPAQDTAQSDLGQAAGKAAGKTSLVVLRKRADFLRAARARRAPCPAFLVQARRRGPDESPEGIRVGFTCSKKVGNAVARNRAKRRLRALAHEILPQAGHPGWDYVLIGRAELTASRVFEEMRGDLLRALQKLHEPARNTPRNGPGGTKPREDAKGRDA